MQSFGLDLLSVEAKVNSDRRTNKKDQQYLKNNFLQECVLCSSIIPASCLIVLELFMSLYRTLADDTRESGGHHL